MNVLTKEECLLRKDELKRRIKDGAIFIHPTDTIYGIGCDATNEAAVKKVREIKKRNSTPFSVIAPTKEWILTHSDIPDSYHEHLGELPGPVTIITKLKEKNDLSECINPKLNTLGMRMPNHWIMELVQELGRPIITTSANIRGEDFMTSLENLNPHIKAKMDFIIYEGEKEGTPSKIIDLTSDEIKEINR